MGKIEHTTTTTIVVRDPAGPGGAFEASLVGLAGPAFGQRFLVASETLVLGRDPQCDIALDDNGVSRLHARIERRGGRYVLVDLESKNGTRVNDVRVDGTVPLADGAQIAMGTSVFKFLRLNHVEVAYHDQMAKRSNTDPLTGAHNRRFAWETLETELARAARHKRSVALIMFDLDHFKRVNDTYGHAAGDAVLKAVAARVRETCRREDMFARVGGEEFLVMLPEADALDAADLAERIRVRVEATPVTFDGTAIAVTVSLGVSDLDELHRDPPTDSLNGHDEAAVTRFVHLADAKLYEAKHMGRNRVAI